MAKSIAQIDALRTLAYTSISGSYAAVGTPQAHQSRIICFTNTTNANVVFSMDGTTDQIIVPAGGFKLLDITANHRPVNQDDYCFPIGTQWYVKQLASSSSGSVFIEIIYLEP